MTIDLHAGHTRRDVTERCVVASLAPFKVAIGNDDGSAPKDGGAESSLTFTDRSSGRLLATLRLRLDRVWAVSFGLKLPIYDVVGGDHHCMSWPRRAWNRQLQDRQFSKKTKGTLSMTAAGVQWTMIFYICPRPVVLVTVSDGGKSNLFPMDLIGPVTEQCFTLALRSTSPSIAGMKNSRRIAISEMPAELKQSIYELGAHHRADSIDWSKLPFGVGRSRSFQFPIPDGALRVRELEISDFLTIGSHTVFATRTESDERYRRGPQLHHASGNYQYFRDRRGRAFSLVP